MKQHFEHDFEEFRNAHKTSRLARLQRERRSREHRDHRLKHLANAALECARALETLTSNLKNGKPLINVRALLANARALNKRLHPLKHQLGAALLRLSRAVSEVKELLNGVGVNLSRAH